MSLIYLAGCLDDDRNGKVHIVGVHKADSHTSVASKRSMHSIVSQHLQRAKYKFLSCNKSQNRFL